MMKILLLLMALVVTGCYSLDNVTLPYTFYQDSIAYASQVNANLDTLRVGINRNKDTLQNKYQRKTDSVSNALVSGQVVKADTIKPRSNSNVSMKGQLSAGMITLDTLRTKGEHLYITKNHASDDIVVAPITTFNDQVNIHYGLFATNSSISRLGIDTLRPYLTTTLMFAKQNTGDVAEFHIPTSFWLKTTFENLTEFSDSSTFKYGVGFLSPIDTFTVNKGRIKHLTVNKLNVDTFSTKNVVFDTVSAHKIYIDTLIPKNGDYTPVVLGSYGHNTYFFDGYVNFQAPTTASWGFQVGGNGVKMDSVKINSGGGHDTLKIWANGSIFKLAN